MPRILDKSTRIIDADFGTITATLTRIPTSPFANTVSLEGNGADQVISEILAADPRAGSFIQYDRVDLSFMLQNNEVVVPVDVSVQRTSPVPLGGSNNGNNFDQIEEYIYVLTRPLNNTALGEIPTTYSNTFLPLRNVGLDGSEATAAVKTSLAGRNAGWPDKAQTLFAEKRIYSVDLSNAATVQNGELIPLTVPIDPSDQNTLTGMPRLDSVTTWGSMDAITGPNLHVYRMVIIPSQDFTFVPDLTINQQLGGITSYVFPPVNISFLCKDPGRS